MVSAYQKGVEMERKFKKILEHLGYFICFRSIRTKFQRVDFAGIADIVAKDSRKTIYVQVKSYKSGATSKNVLESLVAFKNEYCCEHEAVWLAIWKKKKTKRLPWKWKILEILNTSEELKEIDIRWDTLKTPKRL